MSVPNDNASISAEVPDIKDFGFENPGATTDDAPKADPVETPKSDEVVTPPATDETVDKIDKSNLPPSKAEGETDEQFQVRQQIKALTKLKNDSTSDEEKSALKDEIAKMRTNLATLSKDKQVPETPATTEVPDEELEIVKENLRKLGFKTEAEVQASLNNLLEQQRVKETEQQHNEVIKKFYTANSDVAAEPEARQLLEQYVLENFRVEPTTSPAKLAEWMQTARNVLFPRVDKTSSIRSSQDKVDAVNFTGQPSSAKAPTVDDKASSKLKSIGWSDADIALFG